MHTGDHGSRREVVNGSLFESPHPDPRAEQLTLAVRAVLSSYAANGLGTVYGPLATVKLSEHDIIQPSLAFVRQSRGNLLRGGVVEGLPDLIVEVKTDTSSDDALGAKTDRYRELRLPEFWLVYDNWKKGFHAQGWELGRWVMFAMDPVIRSVALPGLVLHRDDVFGDR